MEFGQSINGLKCLEEMFEMAKRPPFPVKKYWDSLTVFAKILSVANGTGTMGAYSDRCSSSRFFGAELRIGKIGCRLASPGEELAR